MTRFFFDDLVQIRLIEEKLGHRSEAVAGEEAGRRRR
jgi:hypothetical protein